MSQPHLFMHELNSDQRLAGYRLDALQTKSVVFVSFDELVERFAQSLENKAGVQSERLLLIVSLLLMNKGFVHQHQIVVSASLHSHVIQNFYFNLGTRVVSFNCSNDLHSIVGLVSSVLAFESPSECSISEMIQNLVIAQVFTNRVLEMSGIFLLVRSSIGGLLLKRLRRVIVVRPTMTAGLFVTDGPTFFIAGRTRPIIYFPI